MTIPDDLQALEDEVIAKLQGILNEREPAMRRLPALLGETSTEDTATVENMPRYCYARVGSDQDVVKLLNVRTPHTVDLAVVVGYDPAQKELFQVLSERGGLYAGDNDNPLATIKHAPQHEWGNPDGFDIPFLQPRQLRGCRPSVTNPNSLSINLDGGIYEIGGVLIEWKGSVTEGALDLTTHVPTFGMRWVLVTMNAAGPATTAGTAKSLVDLTDIPVAADPTDWRVCAVLLKAGDTVITDWPQEQRITDLRFAGSRSVSPGGGYITFGNCIVVAKSGGNFDVIQDGLAAASQETHVLLLNGDWAENVSTPGHFITVAGLMDQHFSGPFGVRFVGADDVGPILTIDDDVLWSCCVLERILSGGSGDFVGLDGSDMLAYKHLSDMQVRIEGGVSGRDVYAAKFGAPAGHATTASRALFVVKDAGSGAAVECVGGDVTFDNMCELRNEDSGGLALIVSGDGVYQFEHARIEGGVLVTGAAEVHFRNCRIAGDVTVNSSGVGATVYTRGVWIGEDISLGTNDELITWQTNIELGATISGAGTVIPIGLVRDGGSHTDHFVGPVGAGQTTYMRMVPHGSPSGLNRAGLGIFFTDWLNDPANYEAMEAVAFDDGDIFAALRTIAGGAGTVRDLRVGAGGDKTKYTTFDSDGNVTVPNSILFNTSPTGSADEGATYWNPDERTLNIVTGWGPVQQVGHETFARVYNDTGAQIDNGSTVSPTGVYHSGWPGIQLAKADSHLTISRTTGMTTMDIPDGEFGLATLYGKVRGLNTISAPEGTRVWVSATTSGDWTVTKPVFPNYAISLGAISVSDASDGVIYLSVSGAAFDTVLNYWNGSFRESFEFTVTSNGTTVTGSLQPSGSATELTMIFSGSLYHFATSPPVLITLTPGTDTNLQANYVYVLESTKALTLSTSGWPATEHIKVAHVVLKSAATTQVESAMRNQFINDHIQADNQQGHMTHLGERIRQEPTRWSSGVQGALTIVGASTPDDLFVDVTGGFTFQLHKQSFPALDMATGDDIHVVNHPTTPYVTTTNLNTQLTDASGGSLASRHWAFVAWAVQNSGSEPCHLMLNLPSDSYNNYDDAINDPDNFSDYNIPAIFQGVGFLVARFVLSHSPAGSGTWTLRATDDLRGFTPNTIAGGGGGAGGATEFTALTDTFASYAGLGENLLQVNVGETGIEATQTIKLANTGLRLLDTGGDHYLTIKPNEDLSDNRILSLSVGDAAQSLTIQGGPVVLDDWFSQSVKFTASPVLQSLSLSMYSTSSVDQPTLDLNKSADGDYGDLLATAAGELLGRLRFRGVNTDPVFTPGAMITSEQVGAAAAGVGGIGSKLSIWTSSNAEVAQERVAFHHDGEVEIFGSLKLPDSVKLFLGTGDDGEIYSSADHIYIANVTQDKDIHLRVNDGGITKTPIFIQGATGHVGIGGVTSPGYALEVESTGVTTFFVRSTALPASTRTAMALIHKTSVNMADGFGPIINFGVEDDTSGLVYIADFGARRDGADNSGQILIRSRLAGVTSGIIVLDATGNMVVGNLAHSAGKLDVDGDINTRDQYLVDGTQIATNRQTGWTAATGTADRGTFVTGSVTLSELAEHVKALVDDLITHGLIGA